MPDDVLLHSVHLTHTRLQELMKLVDACEPFYRWVENEFQQVLDNDLPLSTNMLTASKEQLFAGMKACYEAEKGDNVPNLYDGVGREYSHRKACFYFFSWLVRDAPQQRLVPLIRRAATEADTEGRDERLDIEIEAIAELIVAYRNILKTFEWQSVREVMYDRLEGSRRSIKGHEREVVVRTALVSATQRYYRLHGNYGVYEDVKVANKQIQLDSETFDVSAELIHSDPSETKRLLIPVKTRETEGGGHAHIFTRDINSAIDVSKQGTDNYVVAFIVARNWAATEQEHVSNICDLALIVETSPNNFETVPEDEQQLLNEFVEQILDGTLPPKRWEEIRGLIE